MKITLFFIFCFILLVDTSVAQKSSFIVLGDLHYDLLDDHDMEWLGNKPGDLLQVTEEYTKYTSANWNDFMALLKIKAETNKTPVKAIVQLGDLSEGLAGSDEKARQMAANTMKAIETINMPVPWIIAKGNHDITGPGAIDAFQEYYLPMIKKQTGNHQIESANYSYRFQNIQITCLDPWDKETNFVDFLEHELTGSDAKYKFIAIHQPVIPVTERCWNVLQNDPLKREKLLEIIAQNKAIVLCGHLHRYSVVKRNTPYGPIIQAMAISVIKDRNYKIPKNVITKYGPSLATNVPQWQPETLENRKAILAEEAKYVSFYKQTDLPGYAIIIVDETKGTAVLEYYAAFARKPYDQINLTKLISDRKTNLNQ